MLKIFDLPISDVKHKEDNFTFTFFSVLSKFYVSKKNITINFIHDVYSAVAAVKGVPLKSFSLLKYEECKKYLENKYNILL